MFSELLRYPEKPAIEKFWPILGSGLGQMPKYALNMKGTGVIARN